MQYHRVPFWEKDVGKHEPRTTKCVVDVESILEQRPEGYYLFIHVRKVHIGLAIMPSLQLDPETIVFGPEESLYFMEQGRAQMEGLAERHFKRIAYEYVNWDRGVDIVFHRNDSCFH